MIVLLNVIKNFEPKILPILLKMGWFQLKLANVGFTAVL